MSEIYNVKEGAILKCSLGTSASQLKVPKRHGVCIQGKNQATVADNIPNENIMPFGMCTKSDPMVPCNPAIALKWINGKKNHKLQGEMVLLNNCLVPCMQGGIIKIEQSGQQE
ncbi:DUF4280 domain-containing protein [Lacrimispora xylanisolvens]|uniref:DUF4280 domain-containing protein n=1 Tax=Lacrimispora xylanisolvens TaxID=384636 RepID=UPI002402C8D9|nr:DUF4280 domain-containing protein [Paenibacillaceae bacterium]